MVTGLSYTNEPQRGQLPTEPRGDAIIEETEQRRFFYFVLTKDNEHKLRVRWWYKGVGDPFKLDSSGLRGRTCVPIFTKVVLVSLSSWFPGGLGFLVNYTLGELGT